MSLHIRCFQYYCFIYVVEESIILKSLLRKGTGMTLKKLQVYVPVCRCRERAYKAPLWKDSCIFYRCVTATEYYTLHYLFFHNTCMSIVVICVPFLGVSVWLQLNKNNKITPHTYNVIIRVTCCCVYYFHHQNTCPI